jgi:hypothetical protein
VTKEVYTRQSSLKHNLRIYSWTWRKVGDRKNHKMLIALTRVFTKGRKPPLYLLAHFNSMHPGVYGTGLRVIVRRRDRERERERDSVRVSRHKSKSRAVSENAEVARRGKRREGRRARE